MKLIDLEPHFLKFIDEYTYKYLGVSRFEADGIEFLCPKCFEDNGDSITHIIICWKPNIPKEIDPSPGRWNIEGSSFDDLSLVAGSSSVLLRGGCGAHFFVQNGNIIMC